MDYKAVFLDYYGTLVAEDDAIIRRIAGRIAEASPLACTPGEVLRGWGRTFAELCDMAHGQYFKTQRQIELDSLEDVLARHRADLDAAELSEELWDYWQAPAAFEDAHWFLGEIDVPACIVSNIDTKDMEAATGDAGWSFEHVVTSEMCKAYKPRAEVFGRALAAVGLEAHEVLHVGDSLRTDVLGARNAGIDAAWINRKGRNASDGLPVPRFAASGLRGLLAMLRGPKQ